MVLVLAWRLHGRVVCCYPLMTLLGQILERKLLSIRAILQTWATSIKYGSRCAKILLNMIFALRAW